MADDWFRRRTWTAADEEAFFAKLARARSPNRGQYVRIQAGHLAGAEPPDYAAALSLLRYMVRHHPDPLEMSMAHCQMAECLEKLGRSDEARQEYLNAVAWMREVRQARNGCWRRYALFVAQLPMEDAYDEALAILDEFRSQDAGDMLFPLDFFEWHGARALILDAQGDAEGARAEAAAALEAAGIEDNGLRYHSKLGIVTKAQEPLRRRLQTIAGAAPRWRDRVRRLLH